MEGRGRMKRWLTLLLAALCCLPLASCGTPDTGETVYAPEVQAPDETSGEAEETAQLSEKAKTGLFSDFLTSAFPRASLLHKAFLPLFAQGGCTIRLQVQNDVAAYDAVIVADGADYSLEADLDATTVRMIHIGGKNYLCIPKDSFMASLEQEKNAENVKAFLDLLGAQESEGITVQMNEKTKGYATYRTRFEELLAGMDEAIVYVGRKTVTREGVSYLCETYKSKSGTADYFFEGDALKMIETQRGGKKTHSEVYEGVPVAAQGSIALPQNYTDITALYNSYR